MSLKEQITALVVSMKKNKILILSDHALSPSGVGVQTRFLVSGLLQKD